jgi:hypothetical protein
MSGKINETQQKLSDLVGHIIYFIPCQAHRVNTFLGHSCDASPVVRDLFLNLEQLYVFFFLSSTKRYIKTEKLEVIKLNVIDALMLLIILLKF